jgi:DNA-binding CsgD family transcriptional regulator
MAALNNLQTIVILLSELANDNHTVVWMRTPDYRQQLYISPSFQEVWGHDPSILYEHPLRWTDFLVHDERTNKILELCARNPSSSKKQHHTTYYRILHADGNQRYIRDKCFNLYSVEDQVIAIAGIARQLPETQWEAEIHVLPTNSFTQSSPELLIAQVLQKQTGQILPMQQDDLPKYYIFLRNGNHIGLAWREYCCLAALFQGKSAKDTAQELRVSYRTVEKYFEIVKEKFSCHNKIEFFKIIHPTSIDSLIHYQIAP